MLDSNQDFIVFMYGRIRHDQYGVFRYTRYRDAKHEFLKSKGWPTRCSLCRVKVTKDPYLPNSRTIDHIIPMNIVREYELYALEFDPRNFRMVCHACNLARGVMTLDKLPKKYREKILAVTGRAAA